MISLRPSSPFSFRRPLALLLLLSLSPVTSLQAQDGTSLDRLPTAEALAGDWIWATRNLKDPALRKLITGAIATRTEEGAYPRAELVALLTHPQLAVRLGALELLEEAAGDSFGFNPWSHSANPDDESDPKNTAAIARWKEWAGLEGEVNTGGLALSDEQLQGYLRDIISGENDRRTRAVRMLEPHGLKAVAAIEQFLADTPGLPANNVLALKEAQYHLVLSRTSGENAATLARDLTRGNRDQKLGAISALKKSGFMGIPIVRDFIESPDSLVRETAVDTILALGHAQVVPLVIPVLKKEEDVNVLHAAMRRFREIGGKEVRQLALALLEHPTEDMVVSALETLTKLDGSSNSYGRNSFDSSGKKKSKEGSEKILPLLTDPRWRVRTAALEYVIAAKTTDAGETVVKLLKDEDQFVRAKAIEAAVALKLRTATATLEEMFLKDDDMVPPVVEALRGLKVPLSNELIAHLDTRPPDVIIGAVGKMEDDSEASLKVVARYAVNANLDVACAALRMLAGDYDHVKQEFVADYLSAALTSDSPEKRAAVLSTLSLPSPNTSSYNQATPYVPYNGPPTKLDSLYKAFLKETGRAEKKKVKLEEAEKPDAEGGVEGLKDKLAAFLKNQSLEEADRYRAAYLLGRINDARGLKYLAARVTELSTSQRASIADRFYNVTDEAALPLIKSLLRDDLSQVRQEAVGLALSSSASQSYINLAFTELESAKSKLEPWEFYGYRLESLCSSNPGAAIVSRWARRTLQKPEKDSSTEMRVLALIVLRHSITENDLPIITKAIASEDRWIRRAAWHAVAGNSTLRPWVMENLDTLRADPSPQVRLALPVAIGLTEAQWKHQFNDLQGKNESSYNSSRRTLRLDDDLTAALRDLALQDPSPEVRFETWFTLMSGGKEIDLPAFLRLIPEQPADSRVSYRMTEYIERNFTRMGKGMRPLLGFTLTKNFDKRKLPRILAHFADKKQTTFNSFGDLAQAAETTGGPQQVEGAPTAEEMAEKRASLKVIVFHKPGCKLCAKTEGYLAEMKANFPLMEIDRRNILDDLITNRALCDRFQVMGAGKAPSIFTQAGAAIVPNVKPAMLADLLQRTMELEDDPNWAKFDEVQIEEAEEKVEESFTNLTLPIVIFGGLLDGINPCAFATIIFFLSYLQVAKRSPKEILMVGASFILAIFLAYFAVGLAFHAAVEKLQEFESFHFIRNLMTWIFAGFALLVAVLSLRDGIRAKRGDLKDMTLQLPDFLKNRIRGAIRKRARSRNYVIAAFITGLVISILELACTGQVYAPIVFQIQKGRVDAVLYLLLYNIAFILPLVIIFILAYRGMTSDALVRFQKNHTATVKFATAILFFILTFVILFGEKLLPRF